MFKRLRIDYLLFGVIASLMIALLAVVIWIAYSYSAKQMVQNTSYYQQSLLNEYYNKIMLQKRTAEQISLNASRFSYLRDSTYIDDNPYLIHTYQQEIKGHLAQLTYTTKDIESIHFYMPHALGFDPIGPVRIINHDQLKHESWYTSEVEDTDFFWIDEHTVETNRGKIEVISFIRKIYSEQGDYRGLLMLNLNSHTIKGLMQSDNDANRILLDTGGRTMLSIGDIPYTEEEINVYLEGLKSGSGYMNVEAVSLTVGKPEKHLMVWSKDFSNGWTLIEFTPNKQITAGSVKIALVLLLVGAIAIMIALCSALIVSKQFSKPIKLLLKEMNNSVTGRRKIDLPQDYNNEFGSMFAGYRKLMERIQMLYASLEEQYDKQKEAEIKALQAMINPHFLYNTLDQLNWMAIANGQDKISEILELMGRMFRIGLSNGESLITIRDELTFITCYMDIQKIRLGEQFILQIEVEEEIMELFIPKMTLQPFIENAIIHGFHGRKKGTITISVKKQGTDTIVFEIKDDGSGLHDNWQQPRKRKTGGYGIRNVKERIRIFFGHNYGLDLVNNDGIYGDDSEGATVFIRLPILTEGENR